MKAAGWPDQLAIRWAKAVKILSISLFLPWPRQAFSLCSDHACHEAGMTAIPLRSLACGLGASLLLMSCATVSPESRLRAGLIDAGISPRMAARSEEHTSELQSLMRLS